MTAYHCETIYDLMIFVKLQVASCKAYQLLAHGRWFSPGTPSSSTTKTGRHNIAEILLNVALNTKIKINHQIINCFTMISCRTVKTCEYFWGKTMSDNILCPVIPPTHALLVIGLYELLGNPTT
jgi:hypothetical protein